MSLNKKNETFFSKLIIITLVMQTRATTRMLNQIEENKRKIGVSQIKIKENLAKLKEEHAKLKEEQLRRELQCMTDNDMDMFGTIVGLEQEYAKQYTTRLKEYEDSSDYRLNQLSIKAISKLSQSEYVSFVESQIEKSKRRDTERVRIHQDYKIQKLRNVIEHMKNNASEKVNALLMSNDVNLKYIARMKSIANISKYVDIDDTL
jgi:hypothetical protein